MFKYIKVRIVVFEKDYHIAASSKLTANIAIDRGVSVVFLFSTIFFFFDSFDYIL